MKCRVPSTTTLLDPPPHQLPGKPRARAHLPRNPSIFSVALFSNRRPSPCVETIVDLPAKLRPRYVLYISFSCFMSHPIIWYNTEQLSLAQLEERVTVMD
jgi:hypothetical protein